MQELKVLLATVTKINMINKLTKEQIDSNKKEILTLLGNVKRKGMDEVMSFLKNSTFFVAPNHRDNKKHHAWLWRYCPT